MATGPSYDFEKLERTSRTTGIATLLGALIVIGALVFSAWRLTHMQGEVELLQERSTELNDLIAERQDQLDELGSLIAEAQEELAELQAIEEEIQETQISPQVRAEVTEKSESVRRALDRAAESYSKIKQVPSFSPREAARSRVLEMRLCRRVEDFDPFDCDTSFEASTVYVWARLDVPQKESITIRWMASDGEVVRETSVNVEKSSGYRVFDPNTFSTDDAGAYEVQLIDGAGKQIDSREFTVTE